MHSQHRNIIDYERIINDAKNARMEFVRKNFRLFIYGSSLLGLFCVSALALLSVSSPDRRETNPEATIQMKNFAGIPTRTRTTTPNSADR
jgi:hypothetical protein